MKLPVVRGVIERRLLVNYRVEPDALRAVLPSPFRPLLVDGVGIAGICLIRLAGIRPALVPAPLGLSSENAAHRIAVEWEDASGATREGVYIPRRDSSSRLNTLLGGRLFPGLHHRATFRTAEAGDRIEVTLESADGDTRVEVAGRAAAGLPAGSVFGSLAAASAFLERGAVGYSATATPGRYDGLELRTHGWRVEPLAVERVASTFFEDAVRFPPGSAAFDCALVMRGVAHEWRARDPLCAPHAAPATATA